MCARGTALRCRTRSWCYARPCLLWFVDLVDMQSSRFHICIVHLFFRSGAWLVVGELGFVCELNGKIKNLEKKGTWGENVIVSAQKGEMV